MNTIYKIGKTPYRWAVKKSGIVLVKAAVPMPGQTKTDEQGRNWVFNGQSRRWRLSGSSAGQLDLFGGQPAAQPKTQEVPEPKTKSHVGSMADLNPSDITADHIIVETGEDGDQHYFLANLFHPDAPPHDLDYSDSGDPDPEGVAAELQEMDDEEFSDILFEMIDQKHIPASMLWPAGGGVYHVANFFDQVSGEPVEWFDDSESGDKGAALQQLQTMDPKEFNEMVNEMWENAGLD